MTTWSMTPGNYQFTFRSGLRLQVTPEGDCREATFIAKGQGIGLNPLDAVQISVDGNPVFYGEVRVGGNPADVDGHQFTLRSLALRLKEVVIPKGWSAPKQAAHLTIQSLMQAILPQMGGSITLGTISDLGFDCRAVKNAAGQTPYALLEQIASDGAGLNVKVRFGVNASKEFFCVPAREDVAALNAGDLTGQTKWTAPVAETPCTSVQWFLTKDTAGNWATYQSTANEASVYGVRVKPISLTSTAGLWVIPTFQLYSSNGVTSQANDAAAMAALIDGAPRYVEVATPSGRSLLDLLFGTSPQVALTAQSDSGAVYLQQNLTDGADYLRIDATWQNGNPDGNTLTITEPGGTPQVLKAADLKRQTTGTSLGSILVSITTSSTGKTDKDGNVSVTGTGQTTINLPTALASAFTEGPTKLEFWGLPPGTIIRFDGASAPGATDPALRRVSLFVNTCRPENVDHALLDRLAKFHYSIPATQPADLELRGFHGLAGYVTVGSWQSPVDAWEYRLTAARGLCTGVLAGQADDPTKLAQAFLIKARDSKAIITAITTKE